VRWSCNASGIPQPSPTGACAAEAQACSKCSPSAGASCFGLL
jgi:hypothetical protein